MSLTDILSLVMSAARTPPPDLTPIGCEVLLSLVDGPQHGYGIKLDIEARSAGEISLGSGTLYQAIHRLERESFIAGSATRDRSDSRRGRTYQILPAGRAAVRDHLRRLARVVEYARARRLLPASKP
jgi:DNA-binding PadR family transcriptional regulator